MRGLWPCGVVVASDCGSPAVRKADTSSAVRQGAARDKSSVERGLPHRQLWAGRAPCVEDLVVCPRLGGEPCEEVDQEVFDILLSHLGPSLTRRTYGLLP